MNGNSSGRHSSEAQLWAAPIPPAGLFAFVVEWPSEGIRLTRTEIDAALIREAAARAEELWPLATPWRL
jgi:hypothetical protein